LPGQVCILIAVNAGRFLLAYLLFDHVGERHLFDSDSFHAGCVEGGGFRHQTGNLDEPRFDRRWAEWRQV
jgi:hypothetical protein